MRARTIFTISILSLTLLIASGGLVLGQTTHDDDHATPGTDIIPAVELDDKARVRILLSAYHDFPTRQELLEVSDEVTTILVELANDEDQLPTMRSRAVDALGYFHDDTTRDYLATLLTNASSVDSRMVHHAVTAYAKAFEHDSIDLIEVFLVDDDVQMRLTAVAAMDKHGGEAGKVILLKRLEVEDAGPVIKRLEKIRR